MWRFTHYPCSKQSKMPNRQLERNSMYCQATIGRHTSKRSLLKILAHLGPVVPAKQSNLYRSSDRCDPQLPHIGHRWSKCLWYSWLWIWRYSLIEVIPVYPIPRSQVWKANNPIANQWRDKVEVLPGPYRRKIASCNYVFANRILCV